MSASRSSGGWMIDKAFENGCLKTGLQYVKHVLYNNFTVLYNVLRFFVKAGD
jgi:hypothetical protein